MIKAFLRTINSRLESPRNYPKITLSLINRCFDVQARILPPQTYLPWLVAGSLTGLLLIFAVNSYLWITDQSLLKELRLDFLKNPVNNLVRSICQSPNIQYQVSRKLSGLTEVEQVDRLMQVGLKQVLSQQVLQNQNMFIVIKRLIINLLQSRRVSQLLNEAIQNFFRSRGFGELLAKSTQKLIRNERSQNQVNKLVKSEVNKFLSNKQNVKMLISYMRQSK